MSEDNKHNNSIIAKWEQDMAKSLTSETSRVLTREMLDKFMAMMTAKRKEDMTRELPNITMTKKEYDDFCRKNHKYIEALARMLDLPPLWEPKDEEDV